MSYWLDKPAGKHGFLQMQGKNYVFEDGTPVKFWGVNLASDRPFVNPATAKKWTRFMAKYGINGVRFHKFTWRATDGIHSTQLTETKWRNFDFFCQELREAGIYYGWSHIYGHRLRPADSTRVVAYSEIKNTNFPWSHLNGSTTSLVNFADDLQALNIELTVNMLNHVNPHTGLRYANDPALAFIELQNEDNIFWGAMENTLEQTPTYRAMLTQKFSAWLKAKYETEAALKAAWQEKGLVKDESLAAGTIYPHPNHHRFSAEYEDARAKNRPVPTRIADEAAFLYEEQLAFYEKFVQAIRETGYDGIIIGSCWQAGSGITHFYNLHADYTVGPIDRHNYAGGGTGHRLVPGKVNNAASVYQPGTGLLSTGFQQVKDRPFQISEWMALIPNEWTVESSPIVAAYGMGLQGWDASYAFAMDFTEFTPTIQSGHGVYNVTSPTQLALYPALAAMIYRGDVQEGEIIANRNVKLTDLRKGTVGFTEKVAQQYDIKSFESKVPVEALAIGRVTVSFDAKAADLEKDQWWDKDAQILHSTTDQLHWHYGEQGFFTINTAGTQGFVGFVPDTTLDFRNLRLTTKNQFATVLVSSLDTVRGIADSDRILITTVARARNTGMTYNADQTELLEVGKAPILLEPVEVDLQLRRKGAPTIHVLDHAGNRTGEQVPVRQNKAELSGNRYQAIYYELVYD